MPALSTFSGRRAALRRCAAVIPAVALALALAACASVGGDAVKDGSFPLLPTESATLGGGVALRYDSVEDSRCPSGVQCIVAGRLAYHVSLVAGARSESFVLTEAAPDFTSSALKGVHVVLANPAVPPVRAATAAAPVALPVVLNVFHQ
jgi:hypothetical protein